MMNISGVLIHTRPSNIENLRQRLEAIRGVEVHAISENGKLVVTVEEDDVRLLADKVTQLQDIPDVLSVAMIYHHSEEVDEEQDVSDFPVEAATCSCEEFNVQEASS